jgi:hypothetical protein
MFPVEIRKSAVCALAADRVRIGSSHGVRDPANESPIASGRQPDWHLSSVWSLADGGFPEPAQPERIVPAREPGSVKAEYRISAAGA